MIALNVNNYQRVLQTRRSLVNLRLAILGQFEPYEVPFLMSGFAPVSVVADCVRAEQFLK